MNEAVIVAAKRTPIGRYGGKLQKLEPEDLVKPLIQYFQETLPVDWHQLDDVILGNIVGNGGNIARKSLLEAGLDISIPGVTVDRQCGSGLEAIHYACRMVEAGAGHLYIAGGVESTSRAPWKMKRPTSLYENEPPQFYERASFAPEGQDPTMIEAADNVARIYDISREDQDQFAYDSYAKATQVFNAGYLDEEILPLKVNGEWMAQDEGMRHNVRLNLLTRLKPIYPNGTVTVGNCCAKNDGAALVVVMSKKYALSLGITEGLKFIDYAINGVDPNILGIGPVPAVSHLLSKHDLNVTDIDAIELNEAFASQVLASQRALNIKTSQLNQYGGAIAIGHPYSASGAILVTRLFHMKKQQLTLATMGIGGGMGNAALFERWSEGDKTH
ncbi:thiolase family protein [Staphylococcus sp. IVB6246]|uniref:thiolase family protein n=1 Tax=unclassified Staphylococcus TaxID=91994 RepID=UPI0021CF9848|nr:MULTISPECIES: thiolase family protein [unclassified Staphylococcus]UXR69835.1 thiolase family protein [Staphylococcus sp. IVB6246]UXR71874.1 thiolase family protein [Staphylococcus sp. IVB6240]UXR74181.1 thiolase family protein [Staphylococcus sp. IVB6238]